MDTVRFTLDTTLTLIAAYRRSRARRTGSLPVRGLGRGRALTVTDDGRSALADAFGIDWSA